MKNKLTTKLFLNFGLVLILCSFIVGGSFLIIFANNSVEIYQKDLVKKSEIIAAKLADYMEGKYTNELYTYSGATAKKHQSGINRIFKPASLAVYLQMIDEIAMCDIMLVMGEGDTMCMGITEDNILVDKLTDERKQMYEKVLGGETAIGNIKLTGVMSAASPVRLSDGSIVAAVFLTSSIKDIFKSTSSAMIILLATMLAALLLSAVLSFFLSKKFVLPLKKMEHTASVLARGKYDVSTGVSQRDEIGALAENIDILAKRLQEASKESERLEKLRKNYISNISHELRTPVAVMRGSLEALCDGVVTEEEKVKSYHSEMLSESIHLERMVNDLLELSRLQNPDYKIEKAKIDLVAVVSDAVRSMRHVAVKAEKEIIMETELEAFLFLGDYGRLRQLFIILMDNAIKFSFRNDVIRIKVKKTKKGCIIAVENMGEGIDEKHLPHIFENFYMQKNEQNKTGTGLGLSIASEISARHNLEISATSVKNGKTVFSVETYF